jgi:hypothetical protein
MHDPFNKSLIYKIISFPRRTLTPIFKKWVGYYDDIEYLCEKLVLERSRNEQLRNKITQLEDTLRNATSDQK